jgi:hypothetical protein
MQIVDSYESTVQTHYLTDGERLSAHSVREIETQMWALLQSMRIVFPLRVRPKLHGGHVELVLECRPLAADTARIRSRLQELLAPLPRRPVTQARPAEDSAGKSTR